MAEFDLCTPVGPTTPITAGLNWTPDRFSRALGSVGEKREFSGGAIRDLLSDGFSVTKINRILAEL